MKIKNLIIPIYNYKLNVYEVTSKKDTEELIRELRKFKIFDKEDFKELKENILNGSDGACTYHNKYNCTLIVIIYKQTKTPRRREVLAHEKRHVEDFIGKHLGINDVEAMAYLAGWLAREIFY